MQPVLERGSIDKPLTFDVGLIQLSFIPVCSPNTCNISVKLREGLHSLVLFIIVATLGLLFSWLHMLHCTVVITLASSPSSSCLVHMIL